MNADTVERLSELDSPVGAVNREMPESLIHNEDGFVRLKLKINNLLWEELPGRTTLEDAEKIACSIMTQIMDEKNKRIN